MCIISPGVLGSKASLLVVFSLKLQKILRNNNEGTYKCWPSENTGLVALTAERFRAREGTLRSSL